MMYSVRYSERALHDPMIAAQYLRGVHYALVPLHVQAVEDYGAEQGYKPFAEIEELDLPQWHGEDLNGRSVLIVCTGGIGDNLWFTAIAHELKLAYPHVSIYVTACDVNGPAVWQENSDVEPHNGFGYALPTESVKTFDFVIAPGDATSKVRVKEQENCYDALFNSLGLQSETKTPHVELSAQEERAAWEMFSPQTNWNNMPYPSGMSVLQISTSKESRNLPMQTVFDTIRMLLRVNAKKPVIVLGDGEFGERFVKEIANETFAAIPAIPFPTRNEDYILPLYFNVVNYGNGGVGAITHKIRFGNDLTAHKIVQRNTMLNLRGVMALIKNAAICVAPDSMLSHLSAAFSVPCVTVFGPFNPAWRTSTYPKQIAVWRKDLCDVAPCSWHNAGFPVECPSRERGECAVMAGTTISDIENAVTQLIGGELVEA